MGWEESALSDRNLFSRDVKWDTVSWNPAWGLFSPSQAVWSQPPRTATWLSSMSRSMASKPRFWVPYLQPPLPEGPSVSPSLRLQSSLISPSGTRCLLEALPSPTSSCPPLLSLHSGLFPCSPCPSSHPLRPVVSPLLKGDSSSGRRGLGLNRGRGPC